MTDTKPQLSSVHEPLSCYVLTFNSARRLEGVLASVAEVADDLLVLDSGSSDETQSIAESHGARFLVRQFDNFRDQRQFALSQCLHNWILELDSDEVASPALEARISGLKQTRFSVAGTVPDAFGVRREWFLLGRQVHCFYPSRCPDWPIRLYQRSKVGYQGERTVHEAASGFRSAIRIDAPILHYTCDSIDQMYAKVNQYTTLLARDMHGRGMRVGWFKILVLPWLIWFKFFVLLGGWRDGWLGVVHGRYVRDTVWQKLVKLRYDFFKR
ncbi:glycosyltransferase family 2 protein [Accumulibacter sp.]|uniref:glycosyltransferase family 2 protein n=1 Tax=Accumulibacter sp. TaxID=2053492 RepID=UPI0025FE5395|nr:glycosyltransferase family 2 protein [Accumulibacter sp.]MCM8610800.1 glycosyltransferase family 2 protein [Accumulibacter sp.]MCM8635367.1 glycosyltransferase family 2 protein [Accumulibacter sp.]MCM8638693.1 glycosyltransferase family 2 protein [Accumulibacter sp.]